MSLKDVLRFIVLLAMFATPFLCLYVAESMFFPFITGKNFAFRILVEVMLGAWALLMFLDERYRPRFSWILASAGTFLAVIAAADFLGENPYRSFWSNYERMEGLITHAHLFLYFVISSSVLLTEQNWKWLFRTSLVVSMLVAIYAFRQILGFEEIHQGGVRLDATFGNATYLAVYALFHMFISVFLYFRDGKENNLRPIYLIVALINFVVLYHTQTRGTLLGLVGGALLTTILLAIFEREHKSLRKYAIGTLVGLVALVGIFVAFKDSAFVQGSPTLMRMASISLSEGTTKSRFMIWEMSWEGFKERPILGWGQENFLYVFAKHYNPKMYTQEPWFDRSHDVFFDWLIAGGALGLLAYLSLFGSALYYLWFARRGHFTVLEKSILTGMLAGYFIHNIFVFDNLTSYLVFFAILAYLHTLHAEQPAHDAPVKRVKASDALETGDVAIAFAFIALATTGLIYMVNLRNIDANRDLIASIRPDGVLVDVGNNQKKIALEEVLARDLFGTSEAREQLAQLAVSTQDPRVPEHIRTMFHKLASEQFAKELARDPNNVRTLTFAAMFHARFGEYELARKHFDQAIKHAPNRQSTYADYATMYFAMNDYPNAELQAKIGYELERSNPESALMYATALAYQKKGGEALEVMMPFRAQPVAYDSRLVNALGNSGAFDLVIELVNEKIAKGFAVGRDYFGLAGALLETGRVAEAIGAIEKAIELDSSLKEQGEGLIKQIRSAQAGGK